MATSFSTTTPVIHWPLRALGLLEYESLNSLAAKSKAVITRQPQIRVTDLNFAALDEKTFYAYCSGVASIAVRQYLARPWSKAGEPSSWQSWEKTRAHARLTVSGRPLPDTKYGNKKEDKGTVISPYGTMKGVPQICGGYLSYSQFEKSNMISLAAALLHRAKNLRSALSTQRRVARGWCIWASPVRVGQALQTRTKENWHRSILYGLQPQTRRHYTRYLRAITKGWSYRLLRRGYSFYSVGRFIYCGYWQINTNLR